MRERVQNKCAVNHHYYGSFAFNRSHGTRALDPDYDLPDHSLKKWTQIRPFINKNSPPKKKILQAKMLRPKIRWQPIFLEYHIESGPQNPHFCTAAASYMQLYVCRFCFFPFHLDMLFFSLSCKINKQDQNQRWHWASFITRIWIQRKIRFSKTYVCFRNS